MRSALILAIFLTCGLYGRNHLVETKDKPANSIHKRNKNVKLLDYQDNYKKTQRKFNLEKKNRKLKTDPNGEDYFFDLGKVSQGLGLLQKGAQLGQQVIALLSGGGGKKPPPAGGGGGKPPAGGGGGPPPAGGVGVP